MKIAIIGAGVLGTSLGVLLRRDGHTISAICSRNRRSAQHAAVQIGDGDVVGDPGMAALGADLVLLCVPDRVIASVAIQVSAGGALKRDAVVAHLAGGVTAGILSGVQAAGGHRGSLHPLQSFANVETAVRALPQTHFFVEGDPAAVALLERVGRSISNRATRINSKDKALYHAGAAVASNFLVAIVDYAVELFSWAGISRDDALKALLPLIQGTVDNLKSVGLPDALTGPIARGDIGTVRRHVRALEALPGNAIRLYRNLARKTVEVALQKGTLHRDEAQKLLILFDKPTFPMGDSLTPDSEPPTST